MPTPVSGDLAGRVSALEQRMGALQQQMGTLQQLMQNLQSLIQALNNRLDALEQGGITPVATPTPSPTPTRVSGPDPEPTAIGGDACVQPIGSYGTWSSESVFTHIGTWTTSCFAANPPNKDSGTYYAKFYTFTMNAETEVRISLGSDEPNYLYLLSGVGMYGAIEQQVGDRPSWTNTITATLQPGSYTIEATTYYPNVTDLFSLVMTVDSVYPF